jgi:hypothetical protein
VSAAVLSAMTFGELTCLGQVLVLMPPLRVVTGILAAVALCVWLWGGKRPPL